MEINFGFLSIDSFASELFLFKDRGFNNLIVTGHKKLIFAKITLKKNKSPIDLGLISYKMFKVFIC